MLPTSSSKGKARTTASKRRVLFGFIAVLVVLMIVLNMWWFEMRKEEAAQIEEVIHHIQQENPVVHDDIQQEQELMASKHPKYRIAVIIPWLGDFFPLWWHYFLVSAKRGAFLVDFLIFHEGSLPPVSDDVPENVFMINVGENGLALIYATKLAYSLHVKNKDTLRGNFEKLFKKQLYSITEYKPCLGVVFADYLINYSHWAFADMDLMFGDLPNWISLEELENFDIVTYGFGDVNRLYLRGQLTIHKNTAAVNRLFRGCWHLGAGLADEVRKKAKRSLFLSAEGCYSHVTLSNPDIRIKFSTKALADWKASRVIFLNGVLRTCVEGIADCDVSDPIPAVQESLPDSQTAIGMLLPTDLDLDDKCAHWMKEEYQWCIDMPPLSKEESDYPPYNVISDGGKMFLERFRPASAIDVREGILFHFQQWKDVLKSPANLRPIKPAGPFFICSEKSGFESFATEEEAIERWNTWNFE